MTDKVKERIVILQSNTYTANFGEVLHSSAIFWS
jgi:hypothetical protein